MGNSNLSYDAYIVNGLQDGVVLNDEGITSIPSGKSVDSFDKDNNGNQIYKGRIAISNGKFSEFGLAYCGGVYNGYLMEVEEVDEKRRLHLIAFDFNTSYQN